VSRRALLSGGAGLAAAAAGAGLGVVEGELPGRPWLQARLGLNGEAGVVPDVRPGPVTSGSFVSERRLGTPTGWSILRPPGEDSPLPVVVALHGLGQDHATLTGAAFRLDRFLAAATSAGVAPFAIAAVDGGTTYWHPRPNGEDAGAMVVEEFLPLLEQRGLRTAPIGLIGWSMGGYAALRLGGLLGPDRVAAVAAVSPAIWTDPDHASESGFTDAAEYERFTVVGRQRDLTALPVRVDCGTGDAFYRDVEDYVAGFPGDADLTITFEPGAHDAAYWRRNAAGPAVVPRRPPRRAGVVSGP